MLVMIKTVYETSDAHCSCAPTTAQPAPALGQLRRQLLPTGLFSAILYGVEYFFVLSGSAVSSCDPSQLLVQPQPSHFNMNIFLAQALPSTARPLFTVFAGCTPTRFRYNNFQILS